MNNYDGVVSLVSVIDAGPSCLLTFFASARSGISASGLPSQLPVRRGRRAHEVDLQRQPIRLLTLIAKTSKRFELSFGS